MIMAHQSTMKTARMTILVAPKDKRDIEQRARAHAMSTGEFVRRATKIYDPPHDHTALDALGVEIENHARAMRKSLHATHAVVEKRLAEIVALRRARS
jgi:hypothetical protein